MSNTKPLKDRWKWISAIHFHWTVRDADRHVVTHGLRQYPWAIPSYARHTRAEDNILITHDWGNVFAFKASSPSAGFIADDKIQQWKLKSSQVVSQALSSQFVTAFPTLRSLTALATRKHHFDHRNVYFRHTLCCSSLFTISSTHNVHH